MAWPYRSQEDYDAYKKGVLRKIGSTAKERKTFKQALDKEVSVTDETLKSSVDAIFREDLRKKAFHTFKLAKTDTKAVVAYYNFVNAYELYASGEESYGNICCMALDLADEKLRPVRRKPKNNKSKHFRK